MESIALRWLSVDDILGDSLLAEALGKDTRRLKETALERLGIARAEGESPLAAWLRVMAEENGLPVQQPAHPRLKDAVLETTAAAKFMFWLA